VLRTSERARNIHALIEVRDQKHNPIARVQAVKALEGFEEDSAITGTGRHTPGLVVQIINQTPALPMINVSRDDDTLT
jgi:hypothetical protein